MSDQNQNAIETEEQQLDALQGIERRRAMRRAGVSLGVAAMAASGLVGGTQPAEAANGGVGASDTDILNFALNLEYLEAEYYLYASTGQGLAANLRTGTGTQGTTGRGQQVNFTSVAVQQFAQRIALDELAHVRFLRAALGSAAVAIPDIDVGVGAANAFSVLAQAAGLVPAGQIFNPYSSDANFLLGASIFEDVGVTAYAGASRYIGDPNYLEAAGGILAVEAYHAGAIRTLLAQSGAGAQFNQISAVRGTLSAGGFAGAEGEQGIVVPGDAYNFVATDANGLVYRRNTRQVLNIVYGQIGAAKGGFFPQGLNGNIRS